MLERFLYSFLIVCLMSGWVSAKKETFKLSSKNFVEGASLTTEQVFNGFGCSGENKAPALNWNEPPAGTKSLAITAYDPDAPTGSGWWHWVVFNLPVNLKAIPSNFGSPETIATLGNKVVSSRTDFGKAGFGGACPPIGDKPHRYIFTVWALNNESLPLDENAPAAMVGYYLNQHEIAKASITALYERKK